MLSVQVFSVDLVQADLLLPLLNRLHQAIDVLVGPLPKLWAIQPYYSPNL